jgi:hypothetical protein
VASRRDPRAKPSDAEFAYTADVTGTARHDRDRLGRT